MTVTRAPDTRPRKPALERATAMRLAATEYQRLLELLASLGPSDWTIATECPGWDVHAMASHALGMAEMAASVRESMRQQRAATRRGGVFLDALTGLQVEEHADLTAQAIVARFERVAPKAVRGRRRAPGFVRRRTMPQPQTVGDHEEKWTFGYLLDVILTRDPWMHRIDISRATGAPHVLTADHDGVLVHDVVQEWALRHGRPFTLRLTGPAGGYWSIGTGGPDVELDAVEFCRILSGRGDGLSCTGPLSTTLLTTAVPF
ncbi:MAG: maleylpyruvate isomerase family mycothiol-dependent enzyme [Jatrophihabitantaceae bacterium]